MFLLTAFIAAQAASPIPFEAVLERVAREADFLAAEAPKCITEEQLEQRTGGGQATRVREVVSEFTVGALQAPGASSLVEFRRVISVDGRPVRNAGSARHALSIGMRTEAERERKRMLEDFARHGLEDVATDYSLALLAFGRAGQGNLAVAFDGEDRVGAEDAQVFRWSQTTAEAGALVFAGREIERSLLQGKLWTRKQDGVPLRILVRSGYRGRGGAVEDEATIDYTRSPQGFLAPASVRHRHIVDGEMRTENLYTYAPFRAVGQGSP